MYEKITVDDLADLIEQSGWDRTTFKAFHFEFVKGDRLLILREYANGGWELTCSDCFSPGSPRAANMLNLPYIFSIPTPVLFATLEAYGVVSILTLAASIGLMEKEAELV